MDQKSLTLIATALLMGWLCWGLKREGGTAGEKAAMRQPSPIQIDHSQKSSLPDAPKDPRIAERFKNTEDIKKMSAGDIERYLLMEGRTAKSLTTAYWLTTDAGYLEELKQVAGQSLPALSTLAMALSSAEDRLVWIGKFIEADPDNKLGYFLKLDAELQLGNLPSAVSALNEALDARKNHQYDAEMVLEQRRAWQLLGTDPVTARIRVERHDSSSKQASLQISMALNGLWKKMAADSDLDQQLENVTAFLAAGRSISGSNQLSTVNSQRHALMAEAHILKLLPDNVDFGEDGLAVKDRIGQLNKQIFAEVDAEARLDEKLKSADADLVDHYFQRYDTLGSKAAMDWVLEQSK